MTQTLLEERLDSLESHLRNEHPVLVDAVRLFRQLDVVGRRMALLDADESYATRISWWPLISILGTFSAGKSSFVNHFLGDRLQRTGNQAVDDKFTVICYGGPDSENSVLPGVALDADPRFPFYRMSEELENVSPGEGQRIDAYVQMATSSSERLKGRILIDSPGFDADSQRDEVLRIVDHMMSLSDLALVMFDARHPEPGAMRDTLEHLVARTARRPDSSKFLYVLNQIDTAAREDNPEDIVAAWQRGLAAQGLVAGRFYTIYNPEVAVEIEDPQQRARFEKKRDIDLGEIHERIDGVEVGRAYRIVATLENTASQIEEGAVPTLKSALDDWCSRVLKRDGIMAAVAVVALLMIMGFTKGWNPAGWSDSIKSFWASPWLFWITIGATVIGALWLHFYNRRTVAAGIAKKLSDSSEDVENAWVGDLGRAFQHSTRGARSVFAKQPAGWSRRSERHTEAVKSSTTRFVQTLNDHYAGSGAKKSAAAVSDS